MKSTHHIQSPEEASGQKTTQAPFLAATLGQVFFSDDSPRAPWALATRLGKRRHLESGLMIDCLQVTLATPAVHMLIQWPRAIIPDGIYILHTCRRGCGRQWSSSSSSYGCGVCLEMPKAYSSLSRTRSSLKTGAERELQQPLLEGE